jgi:hypothetical protein
VWSSLCNHDDDDLSVITCESVVLQQSFRVTPLIAAPVLIRADSEKPTRGIHYRGSHSKRARADLIAASYMSASGTAMARGHRLQGGTDTAVQLC